MKINFAYKLNHIKHVDNESVIKLSSQELLILGYSDINWTEVWHF